MCDEVGANCGDIDNGCGGTTSCGPCPDGQSCGGGGTPNVCGDGTCTPTTCDALGYECGLASDGCSLQLDCGKCKDGLHCGGGGPHQCGACAPTTCKALGKNCGDLDDGCGTTLHCGDCAAPATCAGAGVANVCGCTPQQCGDLGKNCGMVDTGCGPVSCGECTGFETCGGAGQANVCGATCGAGCPAGFDCQKGVCGGGDLTMVDIDEIGFTVSGKLTINGAAPNKNGSSCSSYYDLANLTFVDVKTGFTSYASIYCTTTDFTFSATLPRGTYEVRIARGSYAATFDVDLLPVAYVAATALVVDGPLTDLTFDEIGFPVSGVVKVNGETPLKSAGSCSSYYDLVDLTFVDKKQGYAAAQYIYCATDDFSFSLMLPPGDYEVRVRRGSYASTFNTNILPVEYLAASSLLVAAPVTALVLDEVGYDVKGTITVDGAMPTKNGSSCAGFYDLADVKFIEKTKGYTAYSTIYCTTTDFSFATMLPAGNYEVRVERGSYASTFETNLLPVSFLARSSLAVVGNVTDLVLAETGHTVSGTVKVGGATPAKNGASCSSYYDLARIRFIDTAQGYEAQAGIYCTTSDFSYAIELPAGTYDVRVERGLYASTFGTDLLPVSYLAKSKLVVAADVTELVLDEIGYPVAGHVLVNHAMPTKNGSSCSSYYDLVDLSFTDVAQGYVATTEIYCTTDDFSYALTLPAGTYEVRASRGTYATTFGTELLPVAYRVQPKLIVSGAVADLVIDEVGYPVSGHLLVNHAVPTKNGSSCSSYYDLANVTFTDLAQGYVARTDVYCTTTDFGYSTMLPAGVYEVRVVRGSYASTFGSEFLAGSYLGINHLAVP